MPQITGDESYRWAKRDTNGLVPRYEHGILETDQGDIYVFGGAQQSENLNSIQVLKNGKLLLKRES